MTPLATATALAATLGAAATFAVAAPPAYADGSVPFTDSAANGSLQLCNLQNQPITGGKLTDEPFVAKAVSTAPAPKTDQVDGAKATLYAYVPRQNVDPGQWSGQILTGSSAYADMQHPAAQGTTADTTLGEVVQTLPPQWDGLYQLRLEYSGPNRPISGVGYATAVVKVTGSTWTLVSGGTASCGTKTTSNEESVVGLFTPAPTIVPAYINGRPNPRAFPDGTPSQSLAPFHDPEDGDPTSAAPGATSSASGSASAAAVPSSSPSSAAPAQATAVKPASSSSKLGIGLGILGGLIVGGLAVFAALRIKKKPSHV